eukprot:6413562-Pyramimonas_sp.AAC.1
MGAAISRCATCESSPARRNPVERLNKGLISARADGNKRLRLRSESRELFSCTTGSVRRENIPARPASDWSVVRIYPR